MTDDTPHIRSDTPSARWMDASELADDFYTHGAGKILLGRTKSGRLIGVDDNRHLVTIAGSRAGKSATSLMSNLLTWNGSMITIDPKGELATNTAEVRARMGQDVHILDPFGEVKGKAAQWRTTFNPFDELRAAHPDNIIDDAATIADAMIVSDAGKNDHWTMAAKNLLRGLILFALHQRGGESSLNHVRGMVTSPMDDEDDKPRKTKAANFAPFPWDFEPKRKRKRKAQKPASKPSLMFFLKAMMDTPDDVFDGVLSGVGGSMSGKPKGERGSIISTAIEQTAFLDSTPMRRHIGRSGLPSLRMLKYKPTSIYLVLPASRMATHYRWLRLILTQAMAAMEQEENRTGRPVLFILEEFPTLGYLRQIEAAAGLMAGYDVKLWTVMQDLSQIKALYPNSWETFIGNAGIVEAFGNTDATTLDYLSKQMGNTLTIQKQKEVLSLKGIAGGEAREREVITAVPLLAPFEIAQRFAREENNKLILKAGKPPFQLDRIFWQDLR